MVCGLLFISCFSDCFSLMIFGTCREDSGLSSPLLRLLNYQVKYTSGIFAENLERIGNDFLKLMICRRFRQLNTEKNRMGPIVFPG